MTFLQPFLLFGLPALLIPVLIHLLNKRRHRTKRWAATMFLVRATQRSRGRRRLRHFLILACRVLAVAALVFALSRPLAGGWVSWLGGDRPEVIVLLLDRSASMEESPTDTSPSKRAAALDRIREAVKEYAGGARLVLMDSAGGDPVQLTGADALADLPQAGPSQAAADIPEMVERAIAFLATTKPGKAEIWVASDLQASNWRPDDGRWEGIRSGYTRLDQQPPIRILGMTEAVDGGQSLRLAGIWRERDELVVDLEVSRGDDAGSLALDLSMNGQASTRETVQAGGRVLALRKRIPLEAGAGGGWGKFSVPPDLSPGDNAVWFTYGAPRPTVAAVVSRSPAGRILQLAAAPPGLPGRTAEKFAPSEAHRLAWDEVRLVIWQGTPPTGPVAGQLRGFVEAGGALAVFPPDGEEAGAPFLGLGWAEEEAAAPDEQFRVLQWDDREGVLRDFRNGQALALDRLTVIRRRATSGDARVLATYGDGVPAVLRVAVGRGQAVFFTTLPDRRWSNLGDYNVLLPVIERLGRSSARFAADSATLACGEPLPDFGPEETGPWEVVDSAGGAGAEVGVHAGVYRRGGNLLACNTATPEFDAQRVDRATLGEIHAGMRMRFFEERVAREQGLATEIWRSFAIAMLLFLLSEALLSLPPRRKTSGAEGDLQPLMP